MFPNAFHAKTWINYEIHRYFQNQWSIIQTNWYQVDLWVSNNKHPIIVDVSLLEF